MRLGMATHTPQLPRKPRGLMIQSRYHMHVVASAPSPQRGSKWHRQALPSLERFLLISVSGNGNAPKARLRKLAKRSCSLALVLPLCITLPQERPWRLGHLRFRGNLSARGAEQG